MEALIKRFSFDRFAGGEARHELKEALDAQLRSLNSASAPEIGKQVCAALTALTQQVSTKDYPPDGSDACQMGLDVVHCTEFLAEHLVPNASAVRIVSAEQSSKLLGDIQSAAFHLLTACFHYGPTSGHVALMRELLQSSRVNVTAHIQALSPGGTDAYDLLTALEHELAPHEAEPSTSRYRAALTNLLKNLFELLTLTEDWLRVRRKEVLALYLSTVQRSGAQHEEVGRVYASMLDLLHRRASPAARQPTECFIFSSITEKATLHGALATLRAQVSDPHFPRHEVAVMAARSALCCFFNIYKHDSCLLDVAEAVKIVALCGKLNKPPLLQLAQDLSAYCQYMSKSLLKKQCRSVLNAVVEATPPLLAGSPPRTPAVNAALNLLTHLVTPTWTSEEESGAIASVLASLVRCESHPAIKQGLTLLHSHGKLIQWSKEPVAGVALVTALADAVTSRFLNSDDRWREVLDLKEIMETFLTQAKRRGALEALHPALLQLISRVLHTRTYAGAELLPRLESYITYQLYFPKPHCASCEVCQKCLKAFHEVVECSCGLLEGAVKDGAPVSRSFAMGVYSVLQCIISQVSESKWAGELSSHVERILRMLTKPPYTDSAGQPLPRCLLASPALVFVNANAGSASAIERLVPVLLELCGCQETSVCDLACQIGLMALRQSPQVLRGHLDRLLSTLEQHGPLSVLYCVRSMYEADVDRDQILTSLDRLIRHAQGASLEHRKLCVLVLTDIAQASGPQVTPEVMLSLAPMLRTTGLDALCVELFRVMADTHPPALLTARSLLYDLAEAQTRFAAVVGIILSKAVLVVQSVAPEVVEYLLRGAQGGPTQDAIVHVARLKLLALHSPSLLAPHRSALQQLSHHPDLRDDCKVILDALGGRDVGELRAQQEEQRRRVSSARVQGKIPPPTSHNQAFPSHAEDMQRLIRESQSARQRKERERKQAREHAHSAQPKLQECVGPQWCPRAADLLTPPGPTDWRALAHALGYSQQQVRAWMTHLNPGLLLFNHWFSQEGGRESREAEVLRVLGEMGRGDVITSIQQPDITETGDKSRKDTGMNVAVSGGEPSAGEGEAAVITCSEP